MGLLLAAARLVLATALGVAGVAKLTRRASFRAAVVAFGVPADLAGAFAGVLPVVELMVAILLVTGGAGAWPARAAFGLLVLFAGVLAFHVARGHRPPCQCFGARDDQ